MTDFWLSCGHHLLDRDDGGGLVVTDEFLKAYLARPELAPPPTPASASARCMRRCSPIRAGRVRRAEIAAIADADARENWGLMVAFRDHLVGHRTRGGRLSRSRAAGRAATRRRCSSISSCT